MNHTEQSEHQGESRAVLFTQTSSAKNQSTAQRIKIIIFSGKIIIEEGCVAFFKHFNIKWTIFLFENIYQANLENSLLSSQKS
jgi:hypothetical protein